MEQFGGQTLVERLRGIFGRENLYAELQRHFLREEERRNQVAVELARRFHLPLLATNGVCHASPEEREWIDGFMKTGFVDSFRHFNKEPHNYSWWSFRAGSRAKNLGWRIDYNLVSSNLESKMKRAAILSEAKHSDHCPVLLEIL